LTIQMGFLVVCVKKYLLKAIRCVVDETRREVVGLLFVELNV
jgi:hypothetical protein